MNIAGKEINIGIGGVVKPLATAFWSFMILIVVGLIIWWGWKAWKNKTFFVNKITLTLYYENGTKKRIHGLKGGKFVNSSGVWDFKIMIPKQKKKKILGYMPNFSKADSDGTLHFITSGDGTIWQQVDEKLVTTGEEQARDADGALLFKIDKKTKKKTPLMIKAFTLFINPVRTDVKIATVNALKSWSEMVNKNKLTAFGIALGSFLIMVIAHLISLYIQAKLRCPA